MDCAGTCDGLLTREAVTLIAPLVLVLWVVALLPSRAALLPFLEHNQKPSPAQPSPLLLPACTEDTPLLKVLPPLLCQSLLRQLPLRWLSKAKMRYVYGI